MADSVIVQASQSKYTPHPEGPFAARCVDVINLGERLQSHNNEVFIRPKMALVFRTGQKRDDGEFFEISCEFTVSLHEKAGLRAFMESWRGKDYTPEEIAAKIDFAKMEGAKALINVVHGQSKAGRTYGKIKSVMRLPQGTELPDTGDYQRAPYWAERKAAYAMEVANHRAMSQPHDDEPVAVAADDDDSDLPF